MENKQTESQEFMTVGELAKKMGTTVRTLQYYHKTGVLSPTAESQGGRRLYTGKDMVKLHQILSLKSLGFSLDEIKNGMSSLDTPAEVEKTLTRHEQAIEEKIEQLTRELEIIQALKAEAVEMESVDFKKYADIIINLQMNNEHYQLIKYIDDDTLDIIRNRFDKDSGKQFMECFKKLKEKALNLQEQNIPPGDELAQKWAKEFWDTITDFTNGDMSLLPKLMEVGEQMDDDENWMKKQESALEIYFQNFGINPLGEAER